MAKEPRPFGAVFDNLNSGRLGSDPRISADTEFAFGLIPYSNFLLRVQFARAEQAACLLPSPRKPMNHKVIAYAQMPVRKTEQLSGLGIASLLDARRGGT